MATFTVVTDNFMEHVEAEWFEVTVNNRYVLATFYIIDEEGRSTTVASFRNFEAITTNPKDD